LKLVHWLVTLPVTVILIYFAVCNRQIVEVSFWPFASVSVWAFMLALPALVLGFLAGELAAWAGGRQRREEARAAARRIAALEQELRALENRLAAQDGAADAEPPRRAIAARG
jgi:uncharacterized integral membrane protein